MAAKNHMLISGKDVNKPDTRLTINLADDLKEVRGFGKPITRARAKEMAEDYFKDIEASEVILKEIEVNPAYAKLKEMHEFKQLKDLIDPETQTVSGVFGKEIILQILSMRNCEGIRYIIGKDQGKNTVVLIGVKEVEEDPIQTDDQNNFRVRSAPVELKSTASIRDVPIDAEVHQSSLNVTKVREMFHGGVVNDAGSIQSRVDILFGPY